jgi:hypothetical protein
MPSNLVEVLKVSSATRQVFTVNTAVNEVSIPVGPTTILEDVFGFNYFKRMDSPLLLEAGIMLPYSFGLSTEPVYIALDWLDDAGVGEFSAAAFTIPAGPCSISFSGGSSPGLFLPHPGLGLGSISPWAGKARLRMTVITGKVSMINAPAALTGDFKVIPWVRLQHSFALEGP